MTKLSEGTLKARNRCQVSSSTKEGCQGVDDGQAGTAALLVQAVYDFRLSLVTAVPQQEQEYGNCSPFPEDVL